MEIMERRHIGGPFAEREGIDGVLDSAPVRALTFEFLRQHVVGRRRAVQEPGGVFRDVPVGQRLDTDADAADGA